MDGWFAKVSPVLSQVVGGNKVIKHAYRHKETDRRAAGRANRQRLTANIRRTY